MKLNDVIYKQAYYNRFCTANNENSIHQVEHASIWKCSSPRPNPCDFYPNTDLALLVVVELSVAELSTIQLHHGFFLRPGRPDEVIRLKYSFTRLFGLF